MIRHPSNQPSRPRRLPGAVRLVLLGSRSVLHAPSLTPGVPDLNVIAVDANHGRTQVAADLSKLLRVVEVRHRLNNGLRALGWIARFEDTDAEEAE